MISILTVQFRKSKEITFTNVSSTSKILLLGLVPPVLHLALFAASKALHKSVRKTLIKDLTGNLKNTRITIRCTASSQLDSVSIFFYFFSTLLSNVSEGERKPLIFSSWALFTNARIWLKRSNLEKKFIFYLIITIIENVVLPT